MKLFKAKLKDDGLSVEQSSEEHLTAKQKFILCLAAIGGATLVGLVHLVGAGALILASGVAFVVLLIVALTKMI